MDLLNSLAARCREQVDKEEAVARGDVQTKATVSKATGKIAPAAPPMFDDHLKRILDNSDNQPEASRVGVGGYTHVSTLSRGVCARQHALTARFSKPEQERVTGAHRVMWKLGRAIEEHIRDTTIRALNGKVLGEWRCKCGSAKHRGVQPQDNNRCGTCGTWVGSRFNEIPLLDHDYEITGSCDLPVMVNDFVMPYEIKSMTRNQFDDLSAPVPDHVSQVIMYHWLLERNGYRVHDRAAIIYCRKEFLWGSPYKEFHIHVRDEPYQNMIRAMLDTALDIKRGKAGKHIPRLEACPSIEAPRVKKCPMNTMCFQLSEGRDA